MMPLILLASGCALAVTGFFLWRLPRNKPFYWKLIARLSSSFLMCGSAFLLFLFLFGEMMCGRYVFAPVFSSDGELAAQVIEEDCGAVDSFHSSVRVWSNRPVKRLFKSVVFTVDNSPLRIELSWKGAQTLLIRYPDDSAELKSFSCLPERRGIRIECEGYKPDYNKPVGKMPAVDRWIW